MDRFGTFLLVCVFFSGLVLATPTGKGFLPLMLIPLAILVLLVVLCRPRIDKKIFGGALGYSAVLVVNGSGLSSIFLANFFFLVCSLCQLRVVKRQVWSDINSVWLWVALWTLVVSALVVLVLGFEGPFWNRSRGEDGYSRLRLFTNEASYLAVLLVSVHFLLLSKIKKVMVLVVIALTQSYYGIILYVLLSFYRRFFLLFWGSVLCFILIAMYLVAEPSRFFVNSGFIRLIGLSLFVDLNVDFSSIFLGGGMGSGDEKLTPLFNLYGVESGSGFAFSWLYDVGVIGAVFYFMALCRDKYECLLLSFLLCNFGAASIYVPFVFLCFRAYREVDFPAFTRQLKSS